MSSLTSIPQHVGLIPDGARRWARTNNVSKRASYHIAMVKIERFVRFMYKHGVNAVSVYLLSKENLRRTSEDLDPVFDAEIKLLGELLPPTIDQFKVKVVQAGKVELVPEQYQQALSSLCNSSSENKDRHLFLLVAYNPLDEINSAEQLALGGPIQLKHLWVTEPLDLVVRTSGEERISNFLPLQSGYAELFFLKQHFNDLLDEDFASLLKDYAMRQRRFGS